MSEISVIGSGRWGTFLAWYAANYCHMDEVKIYSKPDAPDFIELKETRKNPYLSLMKCQTEASSGDIVYIRGGTYTNFDIAKSSSTYNYIHDFTKSDITYKAYGSEKVIFDFEFASKYKTNTNDEIRQRVTGFMIEEGSQNLIFENFDCTRLPTLSWDEIVAAKFSKNLTQS